MRCVARGGRRRHGRAPWGSSGLGRSVLGLRENLQYSQFWWSRATSIVTGILALIYALQMHDLFRILRIMPNLRRLRRSESCRSCRLFAPADPRDARPGLADGILHFASGPLVYPDAMVRP